MKERVKKNSEQKETANGAALTARERQALFGAVLPKER